MASDLLANCLRALPDTALVLDVGGWADPHERADWVIDIGAWETRGYYAHTLGAPSGNASERFTRETWVQHDVCAPGPWPFADRQFDFVICSQTLEDLRDPIKVCAEMGRVAKAGYVETPGAAIELTRGVESPLWCGWHHHRWLVDVPDGRLRFLAKPHHVHSPLWPSVRSPRHLHPEARANVEFAWSGRLEASEEILFDFAELDSHLSGLAARASTAPTENAARRVAAVAWRGYQAGRSGAGRALRATVGRGPGRRGSPS